MKPASQAGAPPRSRAEVPPASVSEPAALAAVRRMLAGILALGLCATGADLLLIGHAEDAWQVVPLVVIPLSLLALLARAVLGTRLSLRLLRLAMLALVTSGLAGIGLHYRGNREFQLELDPSLAGTALFMKVMRAKAPPTLAPATLLLLGLLGLTSTYRQPTQGA